MRNNRRAFLKAGSLAAVSASAGLGTVLAQTGSKTAARVRDAGMQMCEAYFFGRDEQKMAFCRQMDVLGAVAGIDRAPGHQLWDYESVELTKKNYADAG